MSGGRMSDDRAARAGGRRAADPARTATATPGAGEVLRRRVDSEVRVAGWVNRRRDHGGLIFIDLRDRTGIVQLVFNPDTSGEAFELAHKLRAEDVLSAAGKVVRRDAETVNPELPTGEVEIAVGAAELLADSETPPFQIEGFAGEVGEDTRLRYRYLDLRREPMREALLLRHRVTAAMREFLDARGLRRRRDAGADPLDPRGRARLPRPQPPAAGLLLRAAAVAAAVQAAADGAPGSSATSRSPAASATRRRGPTASPSSPSSTSRCPSSTVDDVIAVNERLLAHVFAARRRARDRAADAADGLRRGDGALRHRPARPALRARAGRPRRRAARDRVQGLPLGARRRRLDPRHQRRAGARCRAQSSTA